jgi:hypothetical protein
MHRVAAWSSFLIASALVAAAAHAAPKDAPSRPPIKDCKWERLADATVGLAVWVERCDFGFRKIDFLFVGQSLAIRYSDGGAPDPLVDVIDRLPAECDAPDGIQYYEVFPASRVRKFLFVRVGQDEPLFDEKTLRLIELK